MALHREIAHQMIGVLRNVTIAGTRIKNVVRVGHSAGSALTMAVVGKYPADLNALILTGISTSMDGTAIAKVAFNLILAVLDPSGRFNGLDKGYLTIGALAQDFQFPFYRYPHFHPKSKSPKIHFFESELLHIKHFVSNSIIDKPPHSASCSPSTT